MTLQHRMASAAEQSAAEELGARVRELVLPYVRQFAPGDVDAPTLTMNVACALVQSLGQVEVETGGRIAFVEGVGYALGLIHAQYAEQGCNLISSASARGFARGAADGAAALRPVGVV